MDKQWLARKRNWFKYILTGMVKPINASTLTEEELNLWYGLLKIRGKLLDNFDESSREMGLKVPKNRCWCGKEGKYTPEYDYYKGLVCKKHIKR